MSVFTKLYKQISENIDDGDYDKVISLSDQILEKQPNEKNALECKCVALIQNGKYEEALELISKNEKQLDKVKYKKAYCYYALNKLDEAISLLEVNTDDIPTLHLIAQIYYKQEKWSKAMQVFDKLVNKLKVDDVETITNMIASYTMGGKHKEAVQLAKLSQEITHELSYNVACAFLGLNDLDQAFKYLKEAEQLAKQLAEQENMSEEELETELASILVQTAYVQQLQGKTEEPKDIYNSIIKKKSTDQVAQAIAGNNLIALRGDTDLFDSAKRMRFATSDKVMAKLNSAQRKSVNLNNALLLMYMNKYDECRRVAENLQKQFPDNDVPPLVISALNYREHKFEAAFNTLKTFINSNPSSIRPQLTLAQMYLNKGNVKEAAAVLEKISIRHEPAIVGALASLYLRLQDPNGAIKVIDDSCQYWKQKFDDGDESVLDKLSVLVQESASLKIQNSKYEEASKAYETLVQIDPGNKSHLAGLVQALSFVDIEKAEQFAKQLPEIDTSDVDAKRLERQNVSEVTHKVALSLDIDIQQNPEVDKKPEKKKRKKKKKKLTPQQLANQKKLDPERWLPKHLRSSNKKKAAKFSQGSTQEKEQAKLQHKLGQKGKLLKVTELKGIKKRRGK